MSTLFNKKEADEAVIDSLLMTLAAYQGEETTMQIVLFKNENDEVCQAVSFEQISRDEIVNHINHHQAELDQWNQALANFDSLTGGQPTEQPTPAAQPEEPTTPVDNPPAQPEAPTEVVSEPATEEVATPVVAEEQPAEPTVTDLPAPVQIQ